MRPSRLGHISVLVICVGLLIGAITPSAQATSSWRSYLYGPRNTASNVGEETLGVSNAKNLSEIWHRRVATGSVRALVSNGLVLVSGIWDPVTKASPLEALRATTGRLMWSRRGGPITIGNGLVYEVRPGRLRALDLKTGVTAWTAKALLDGGPIVTGGVVYVVGGKDSEVFAYDARTGERLWRSPQLAYISSLAIANGMVFVAGDDDPQWALDASTGAAIRQWPTLSGGEPPFVIADGLLLGLGDCSCFQAVDLRSASWPVVWSHPYKQGSPAVSGDRAYQTNGSSLTAFDLLTGTSLWSVAPTPPVGYPAVANGVVYVTSGNDIDAFDASDGTLLWRGTATWASGPPSIAEGMVFDVSADGVLHAYGS